VRVEHEIHPLDPSEIQSVAGVLGLARLHQGEEGPALEAGGDREPEGDAPPVLKRPQDRQQ